MRYLIFQDMQRRFPNTFTLMASWLQRGHGKEVNSIRTCATHFSARDDHNEGRFLQRALFFRFVVLADQLPDFQQMRRPLFDLG